MTRDAQKLRRKYFWRHLRGMTLIELLIAISITSTLAVAGYRALASLTSSATQLTETTQRWQTLDAHADAIERAYRRAAPGRVFALSDSRLQIDVQNGASPPEAQAFGAPDATIARWNFSAWNGLAWSPTWNDVRAPSGLRVSMTTAQGETVERLYAR